MNNGKYINKYTDGTVQAVGQHVDGKMDGYWEWFRKDGSKMRSGNFDRDKQVGEWITYDRGGKVVKKTMFK
jgi:antitoxin component YwqK of YwqJK toxin-antitoxin module